VTGSRPPARPGGGRAGGVDEVYDHGRAWPLMDYYTSPACADPARHGNVAADGGAAWGAAGMALAGVVGGLALLAVPRRICAAAAPGRDARAPLVPAAAAHGHAGGLDGCLAGDTGGHGLGAGARRGYVGHAADGATVPARLLDRNSAGLLADARGRPGSIDSGCSGGGPRTVSARRA